VKRFRFTSSVVYDAASLIEMITPFYPQRFLLLATIANVGKSVVRRCRLTLSDLC
jgi:glutamate N-acetyltransferase/amino-acid N-acetyltransferase